MTTTTTIRATVWLSSDGMGDEATEADYDSYVAYVSARIDERCGFEVDLNAEDWGRPCLQRTTGDSDDRETADRVVQDLWDEWCAVGAPAT